MQIQSEIQSVLDETFEPLHVELVNESHMHSVPANSETHFKLTLVAPAFAGLNKVKRHQQVYQALQSFMANGVHALAIHAFAPDEWGAGKIDVPESPNCMGGSKNDN